MSCVHQCCGLSGSPTPGATALTDAEWVTMLCSGTEGMGLARWLVLGLLLIGCAVGTGSAIAVTGPVVIDTPGTYELTKDILDAKAPVCIEIRCDDVVFDGRGHRVTGVDAANSAGVLVHGSGPVSNVVIRNLATADWFYGVYVWGAQDVTVSGVTASSNYFGIALNPGSDTSITNSRFTDNSYGMVMTGSTRNTVSGCRFTENDLAGISLYGSAGNTFSNNLFKNGRNVAFINGRSPANAWNVEKRAGTNIAGGPAIGGNCWLSPDGDGFSQTGEQAGGFITRPYTLAPENVDSLPLAAAGSEKAGPTANATPGKDGATPVTTPVSKPFGSHALPGTIQFEDFDRGGPGVGYYTPAPVSNTLYRAGTIAIDKNADGGGLHLTGSRYREWLRYTVEAPRDGVYTVTARVSSPSNAQYFKVIDECHPKNAATVWVPNTKSYDTFTVTKGTQLRLTKGTHTLKVFSYGTQDMDWFRLS
jgi:parallel beta-helix repeat protein